MSSDKKYSLNYRQMLEDRMPVTFDSLGIEDGEEVERMWLGDIIDGKYVEDYVVVRRSQYDIEKDEYGAVLAKIENGRMLVKAPNVKYYRIPEDVYRIAVNAFKECTELEEMDVPYMVDDYQIDEADVKQFAAELTTKASQYNEVIIIEAVDANAADRVATQLNSHLDSQLNTAKSYDKDAVAMIEACSVKQSNNIVYLVISDQSADINKTIEDAI